MAEVLFYHLTTSSLEEALPVLLEKTLARGWRALVRGPDPARLERLDALLWTRREDDFLPHGLAGGPHDAEQPILLAGPGAGNPNGAQVLMLIDGARVDPREAAGFERVCLLFEAADPTQLGHARADWKLVTEAGMKAKYLAQEKGRWVQRAESGA